MTESPQSYRVLARKYRPETFDQLVGQDAMVRVLSAAFETGRIAQAFVLTGIRGTGKTTTARIIAKGLNCVGPDGNGTETVTPCGVCAECVAIQEGRHVDVLEIDAASNTGVQNVRDAIIDTVAYAPSRARYKVFIIDEVHMLSTSAFNALLKTLEEPPAHVKFILATTDIQKVPVTVLSRCQRFDLRRIEPEAMVAMLQDIAEREGATVTDGAAALLARAAEGSARDAQSLLDQAIGRGAGAAVDAEGVRAMLGLADRGRVLDLFDLILRGDAAGALHELAAQYADGADPAAVLKGLAEATHWTSVIKITPEAADDPGTSPDERDRGRAIAGAVPMRVLSRMWQMLLRAGEEVASAPNALMAAEMAVIRLTHAADLPSPDDLIRRLKDAAPRDTLPGNPASDGAPAPTRQAAAPPPPAARVANGGPVASPGALARYGRFEDVVALIRARRDVALLVEVEAGVRLVSYAPGRIEFTPAPEARPDLAQRLGQRLAQWTGARWGVSVSGGGTALTIEEVRRAKASGLEAEAKAHPMVQAVLQHFPQARITRIESREAVAAEAQAEALEEVPEEWDPFEED
ncbi:DNA polymerase III subunit gamma/tau [Hasllibacter halocynthiae]|uniref:DNA polymerase III subunit gamma/tau n=1 Tax=Hasllibacter halocynthiae TaxID=595589 RepID=UPI000D07E6C8|nr:DNA polymerase III subunit gamma/tau [Hasllibacter halocynthiae]